MVVVDGEGRVHGLDASGWSMPPSCPIRASAGGTGALASVMGGVVLRPYKFGP